VINSVLEEKEWFSFIDSVYTDSIKDEKFIDSVSLYFMKVNTPSVIAKSKYIFWRRAKPVKSGDFNLFIPFNKNKFLLVSNGKRNIIVNEIEVKSDAIKETKKIMIDLNKSDSLQDQCNQISGIEHKVVNKNVIFSIEIFQSCFDKYLFREFIYPLGGG
jgi:hypothetical protein